MVLTQPFATFGRKSVIVRHKQLIYNSLFKEVRSDRQKFKMMDPNTRNYPLRVFSNTLRKDCNLSDVGRNTD